MSSKKWNKLWENLGKAFFDIGKLTFGSMVLGAMLKGEADILWIFLVGLVLTGAAFLVGAVLILISED